MGHHLNITNIRYRLGDFIDRALSSTLVRIKSQSAFPRILFLDHFRVDYQPGRPGLHKTDSDDRTACPRRCERKSQSKRLELG